ncbi:MAG TPA: uroporphyrinogen decarboxylase family protein [Armatimonadota bacterium]|nr:uroporphyrinogen decarboxylase family protein [Armatimonadota bacterium]
MTFRERTLAIFAHKPVDGIVYQPRIEHWFWTHQREGTLPERYKDMSDIELYDDIGCSCRSYHFFNPCLKTMEDPSVRFEEEWHGDIQVMRHMTPVGTIETRNRHTSLAWHTDKYPVETPDDARVMEYILQGRRYEFDHDLFAQNDALLGDRSAPMIYIFRVNLLRLYIEIMGIENTMYALADDLPLVERLIEAVNRSDDGLLRVVAESPVPIVNFGDNLDQHMVPPRLFERYVLPEYQRRIRVFKAAGKFTNAHWDGSIKQLLGYARRTGLDGIEALTPIPQGDVTIQEIKDALGDMVVLDGIPMTWFLPHEKNEDLERVTREIIETFSPNLILGVSDEISPVCDIEKVRFVAEIVKEYEKGDEREADSKR